ncbi:MAG: hypothetical protein M1823_006190 [Watsoniomyces obsoletus]|nr:MAG: hypothetical protein M1823_006190 [Watsoniomyces obsoletus]
MPKTPRRRGTPVRMLVVLGSGGHTAEMLSMIRDIDPGSYTHRSYLVTEGDEFSANRARDFEKTLNENSSSSVNTKNNNNNNNDGYDICVVPRARKIHQSLWTTPFSVLHCLVACFQVLRAPSTSRTKFQYGYPDVVVTNGPGIAVCVVVLCLLFRFLALNGTRGKLWTIYVESWARVRELSLSGKLLLPLVDRFFVQWEYLKGVGGRGEYIGVLVL